MYKRTIWTDHVEGVQEGTDLNAANLNNIEAGTMEANALAALNASYRRYENDVMKDLEVQTIGPIKMDSSERTISIKPRNNTNYRVDTEISIDPENMSPAHVFIYEKNLNSFKAKIADAVSGGTIDVRFHVSGGMN